MSNKERINLLTDVEIETLYARPRFNDAERDYYFQLNDDDRKLVNKYTGTKTKIYLILLLGYFKAVQQFDKFTFDDVKEDVDYIIKKYFDASEKEITGKIWHEHYTQQK